MIKKSLTIILSLFIGFGTSLFFIEGSDLLTSAISRSLDSNSRGLATAVIAIEELEKTPETELQVIEVLEESPQIKGLTMFRGNKERNFYGTGPIAKNPKTIWRYPDEPMCKYSTSLQVTNYWCGAGWTGQPVVWERPDGITEVVFGAYDGAIHFVDAETGKPTRDKFQTGDIIKGSFTLDTDGFPLLYGGSRDNKLRIIALDRDTPTQLWALDSEELPEGIWNNDWDSNPVIVDGVMYEGGENGWFYAIELNRSLDENGLAVVDPEIIFEYAGYNDELIAKTDENLSIENSPLVVGGVVYVANSGGRIMGFDIKKMRSGGEALVFDFWAGDDIDATLVTDGTGAIYAVVEEERFNQRSEELGQILKLNPKKKNPLVWSIQLPSDPAKYKSGIWATPAIYKNYLYVTTHLGELLVVDKSKGKIVWRKNIGTHAWSSPSVVDGTLVVATCEVGGIQAYDLASPAEPRLLWNKPVGSGCIEATPAIWKGAMYVGNRDGYFYRVGD
jgi:outer membrane protein assembly factor BamB